MYPLLSYLATVINALLSNQWLRAYLFLVTTVFIGYTLQPVAPVLDRLFNNSLLFKFGVLVVSLMVTAYPLSGNELVMILIVSAVTLYSFELMRSGTRYLPMKPINRVLSSAKAII